MIKLDQSYSDFIRWGSPGYPGGEAIDTSSPDSIDGTPVKSSLLNDINGFFQALIMAAYGEFAVNGQPDSILYSDRLKALYKIIENIFGRVPTSTEGPFTVDISSAKRYQLFFTGSNPENARIFLPDISAMPSVDVVEVEVFNCSMIPLKIVIFPESELATLPSGGWIKIRPYNTGAQTSGWGHSYHYADHIVPLAPVRYDGSGRIKSATPVLPQDVLRMGDTNIYTLRSDFSQAIQFINANTARIDALEQAVAHNITENPFLITFLNLDGINLTEGAWDAELGRLECSYAGGQIIIAFTNLNNIDLVSGIWDGIQARLEC
jgi:hypothetical protein